MQKVFRSLFLILLGVGPFLFRSCEKEYIDLEEQYYVDDFTHFGSAVGSIEFKIQTPYYWGDQDFVRISFDHSVDSKRTYGYGDKSIVFPNLKPDDYTYHLEEWVLGSGIATSTGISIGSNGGWSSAPTTYIGVPYWDQILFSSTAEVKAGQRLIIKIELK